ncbi:alpha/beta hydrolase [Jatrophihabitans telluris]|uniref:Alpha/beta hydrolase n=1 Tax=Jatrophihabitans telluris TaxID=2038343 RepID=A0ABY4R120_9ACTN|nr:alpha/beta hydrolase [Jatrophihabitans telluris]UQX88845.1 alpha/beta hydrolase [Jatrophihabitans telluris]
MSSGPPIPRRSLLGLLGLAATTATLSACSASLGRRSSAASGVTMTAARPATASTAGGVRSPERHRYGSDESQWADLYRPRTADRDATIVVIHGGFWRSEYGADLGAPLAADLARRGWTAWNIEYRRVGSGGGWPGTLTDVAAAFDALGAIDSVPSRVLALGHSAGGQLAAWAAARSTLPSAAPGSRPAVAIAGVVAQAGVLDLTSAAVHGVGGSAVPDLIGGSPAQHPERYRWADPTLQLPLSVPLHCIHAHADVNVPYSQSQNYVDAARGAGAVAQLHTVPGDHFSLIDITTPAWSAALSALESLTS